MAMKVGHCYISNDTSYFSVIKKDFQIYKNKESTS